MFGWLTRLFSPKVEDKLFNQKTTKHFESFKVFFLLEQESPYSYYSEGDILCRYMFQTKKSPFEDDPDFKLAKATLKRNSIDPNQVKFKT
jgi:hypothetical protein